jgi:hypothetical protein
MIKNVYGESAAMIPDDQQSVYDWGVIDERERIIKLLEGFDPRTAIGDLLPLLIKGENK